MIKTVTSPFRYRTKIMSLHSRLTVTALVAALSLVVTSCDTSLLQDLENDLEVILNIPGLSTVVGVQILDARTGEPVLATTTVTVTGDDAALVIDPMFFEAIQTTTTDNGGLTLGIQDGVTPTSESPVRFRLHLTAPGYIETSALVVVSELGLTEVEVLLVDATSPPEGAAVVTASAGQASADGTTTGDVSMQTQPEPVSGGTASVQIPAGTRLTTQSGEPLQGALSITMSYFNNESETSLDAFPGGLAEVEADGENGAFISAGFVSIDVTDGQGRHATNLSQAAVVTVSMPEGMINPETGSVLKAGDEVPLWSLDPATGEWTGEGSVIVQSPHSTGLQGNMAPFQSAELVAQFSTPHLSYFNFDWFTGRSGNCGSSEAATINFNRDPSDVKSIRLYTRGNSVSSYGTIRQTGNKFYNFPRSITSMNYEVFSNSTGRVMVEGTISPVCGSTTTVQLPDLRPGLVDLDLSLELVCPSGGQNTVVRPSYPVYFKEMTENSRWRVVGLTNGRVTIRSLMLGSQYRVGVSVLDGGRWSWEERTFTLTEDSNLMNLGANLELLSSERVGDVVSLAFRATGFEAICSRV